MNTGEWIALLKKDVVPALGCTEPVCVALAAANAGVVLQGEIQSITVEVNAGIYKNGMSAGIPHCHEVGLNYAAALGACLKNPGKGLELFEDITDEILDKAAGLIHKNAVQIRLDSNASGLYVKCTLRTEGEESICIIRDAHTNVVLVEKDGTTLFAKDPEEKKADSTDQIQELKNMTIAQIRSMVDLASEADLEFLEDGVVMNEQLAAFSEENGGGVGIADAVRQNLGTALLADDLLGRMILKVSSAAESRLDGCPLPTMSSSGAGTKGIVVILPVSETADAIGAPREKRLKALAFAHLVNRYINAHIGKLSPMCSCVMASSTAAAAGITYLLGGTDEQIGYAIRNMAGTVTGMICDGGKVGCALKVSTGTAAALLSAVTAVQNAALRVSDGICAPTPEECIRNMATIGKKGMAAADKTIIEIMTGKK